MMDLKKIDKYLQNDTYEKIQEQVSKGRVGKPMPNEHQKKLRQLHIEESGLIPDKEIGRERILLDNDLLGINYLSRGLRASKSICRVVVKQEDGKILEYGTGFMISPQLFITNNHVIPNIEKANNTTIQFDYEINIYKELKAYAEFRLNPAAFFVTHDKLDYTIIAVEKTPIKNNRPLNDFGWLKLYRETGKVVNYEYVTIIQHPNGEAKQIALRENKIIAILDNYLRYHTDTAPGSSGACVFNDQWQVVALHHMGIPQMKGDKYVSVDGKLLSKNEIQHEKQLKWIANQGVRISKILENLVQRQSANLFIEELMQKNVQLTTQEFEKMMDELNKNIQSRYGYRKNKEYEATDHITGVKDGLTIQIPITIEFGTNGNISVNALSKEQPDKDVIDDNKTPAPVSSGGEIFTEAMVVDPDYTIRTGYDKYFISIGKRKLNLSLPKRSASLAKKSVPLISNAKESELKYFHYSVVMHKERRMAIYTAVNLDGKEYVEIKRKDQGGKDKWFLDPRIDALYQLNDDLYEKNKLDRGHLVTRTHPNWGTKALAGKSNNDTFHHTNACPQHKELNQKEWEMLEEYMRRYAVDNKTRISIFTGPVFSKNDPPYRDGVNLPLEFWKIIAFVKNGKLQSAGYIKSQIQWIEDLEDERLRIDPDAIKTWQVPIEQIQKLTHLTFDSQIVKADIYKENGVTLEESLATGKEFKGKKLITSETDLGF